MAGDCHLLCLGSGTSPLIVIEERRWFCDRNVVVRIEVPGRGLPVAVRRLVLKHQHERLGLVSLFFHPFQSEVRDDVSRVADVFDSSVVFAVAVRILVIAVGKAVSIVCVVFLIGDFTGSVLVGSLKQVEVILYENSILSR